MYNEVSVLHDGDGTLVGACGNLLVVWALGPPSMRDCDAVLMHGKSLANRFRSGIGLALHLGANTRPPPSETRDMMMNSLRSLAPYMQAMSCAVPGEGFGAAAKRSVVSFMLMTVRLAATAKTFGDVRQALNWTFDHIEGHDGVRFDRDSVIAEVKTLSQRPAA